MPRRTTPPRRRAAAPSRAPWHATSPPHARSRESLCEHRREVHERLRGWIRRIAQHHRLPRGKGLGRRRAARNRNVEDHVARKIRAQVFRDALAAEARGVVHREHDAVERQLLVRRRDLLNAAQHLRRRLQRERLALERDDHVLAELEHAPRNRAEPGRRVDDHDLAPLARDRDHVAQQRATLEAVVELDVAAFGAHAACKDHAEPGEGGGEDDFAQRARAAQEIRDPVRRLTAPEPHTVAHRALRIRVDEQRLQPSARKRGRQVHRCRGLADAALLADDGEDMSHALFRLRDRRGIRAGPELLECDPRMRHPPLRFRATRRMREERGEMLFRARRIAALEQQKREPVVRAAQLRIEIERAPVTAQRILETPRLRKRDRHVLEDARIARPVAQGETVRGERGIVIALSLECERFAQIVEPLWLRGRVGTTAGEPAPPGHAFGGRGRGGRMHRRKMALRGTRLRARKSYRLRHGAATVLLSSKPRD